ncbi:MAG: DUF4258 domain-containing protein [Bacteroidetes bacterium]|nr:DUF4258 domain-containing protein [Bacteroidota bacterium]
MYKHLIIKIKEYTLSEGIRFRKHALVRIVERNISIDEIEEVLKNCNIIMEYAEDKPLVSYLVTGFTSQKRPLHIVIALDEKEEYIWIVTVYEPDKDKWDETFTKRL